MMMVENIVDDNYLHIDHHIVAEDDNHLDHDNDCVTMNKDDVDLDLTNDDDDRDHDWVFVFLDVFE